jgi:hypothetical protein
MPIQRTAVLTLAIAFLVAACSTGSQGAGGAAQSMTVAFAAPQNGAQVTIPFDVRIDSSVPLGEPGTGNHHAHIYFDTGTDAADYDIVYGTTWQVTRPLAPGQHTLILALANPDHSLAGPTQTIMVTVGGGGQGGSGAPGASASPAAAPSAAPSGSGITY